MHQKLADCLKENKYVKNAHYIGLCIFLLAAFYVIITNKVILTWIGGIAAVLSVPKPICQGI